MVTSISDENKEETNFQSAFQSARILSIFRYLYRKKQKHISIFCKLSGEII